MKKTITISILILFVFPVFSQGNPVKIGVIGLTHTHVHWIFSSEKRGDYSIEGIVEPNRDLARRYANQYGFSMEKVFNSMDDLIAHKEIEAVTAFGSIYEHLGVVEFFASRGIHVMVEKPLAVNLDHALKMQALAKKYNIHLLTNYETTWYPTNHKAYELVKRDTVIGAISKIIVRDGHKGPKRINIDKEFFEWLTDPELNGGGAITDFGCYGVNLLTWIMDGEKPLSVSAITRQLQRENNPNVDDEAVIILNYENSMAIIEPSWNWPIGRKDMEIYGLNGVIYADNKHDLRIRISEGYDGYTEEKFTLEDRGAPYDDPFSFFAAVIRNEIEVPLSDLSSLENNMVVMEILDAAKRSAKLHKMIEME